MAFYVEQTMPPAPVRRGWRREAAKVTTRQTVSPTIHSRGDQDNMPAGLEPLVAPLDQQAKINEAEISDN